MVFEAPSGQGVHAVAMQPQMPRGKLPYVVSDPRQQEALSRDAARRPLAAPMLTVRVAPVHMIKLTEGCTPMRRGEPGRPRSGALSKASDAPPDNPPPFVLTR